MDSYTPEPPSGAQLIQGYVPGGFRIADRQHQGSILVFPDRALAWTPASLADVTPESLAEVREADPRPEILVLGTGADFLPVSRALREAVRAWGPIIEPMATPAACRTYNVLLAEGRRVAAALIAVPAPAT